MDEAPTLARRLSFPLLVLYGLGTTIGAGIYVLLGEVSGRAGALAPLAFAVASLLAAASAVSFAALSSRFPRSAGEAVYVREGLGGAALATGVGLLVATAGCVSAATMAVGFSGTLATLVPLPDWLAVAVFAGALGGLAAWGVTESVTAASVVTVVEVAGILAVLAAAAAALDAPGARLASRAASLEPGAWRGVFAGSVIAFYAYLGFEDMVNVAEEVVDVRRVLPAAIFTTLAVTALLYVLLTLVAVLAVPPSRLAASEAPLVLLWEETTGRSGALVGAVGVVALVNGALIQMIMASRVLYGLAAQGSLPAGLGRVHPRTRTPLAATGLVVAVVLALALALPLAPLAETTSLLTLVVFALVNLALLRLQRRGSDASGRRVPAWIPAVGFVVSLGFVAVRTLELLRDAAAG